VSKKDIYPQFFTSFWGWQTNLKSLFSKYRGWWSELLDAKTEGL
jgi:hypothetical protein